MKILFICTHNRCRSILFEAIARDRGNGLIDARSAGSEPAGEIHPQTLAALSRHGYNTADLRSQSWNDLESFAPDLVITVCDSAAGESCPVWFGRSIKLHWPLQDPSTVITSQSEINDAFDHCIATIEQRTDQLRDLLHQSLSAADIRDSLGL